jgi:hypothetical protein
MTAGDQPAPIGVLLRTAPGGSHLVVTVNGIAMVVLDALDAGTVLVCRLGQVGPLDATLTAVPVTDPRRQLALLHDTVATLHRAYAAAVDDQRRAEDTLRRLRVRLRAHLLGRFRRDELGRDELNTVLRGFSLPTLDAPIRVHYTLTGSIEIDVTAAEGVDRAAFTVGVDLAQVDLLVDGSAHHQATVKVYPSAPIGLVVYTVTGHYDVTAAEPGFAATEANSYLYPDLSHLVGVREGTDSFHVDVRTEVRDND